MPVTAARARGWRKLLTLTDPRPSRGCVGEDGRVSTPVRFGAVEPVGYAELLEQVTSVGLLTAHRRSVQEGTLCEENR
jgi:hypothetical protein